MKDERIEKKVFDRVVNTLTEHNLVISKDYVIEHYNEGCFYIRFCNKRPIVVDIQYMYERIPDISILKIKNTTDGTLYMNLKVRLRR